MSVIRFGSNYVARFEQSERETGNQIMPGMREDACAQAAAMQCQHAEERAAESEQKTFRARPDTHEQSRKTMAEASTRAATPLRAQAMKVAAKDNLLDETNEQAEQRPLCNFSSVGGRRLRQGTQSRDLLAIGRESFFWFSGLSGMSESTEYARDRWCIKQNAPAASRCGIRRG